MKKYFVFCCVALLYISELFSQQRISKNDKLALSLNVSTFLARRDTVAIKNRQSELSFLLLAIDSVGRVAEIHLFSDENRRGKTNEFLRALNADHFAAKRYESCAGATVFIPVKTYAGASDAGRTYADKFIIPPLATLEPQDWNRFVLGQMVVHAAPTVVNPYDTLKVTIKSVNDIILRSSFKKSDYPEPGLIKNENFYNNAKDSVHILKHR